MTSRKCDIRRAQISDVPQAAKLINDCAEQGLMLHRSLPYLYEHVRDFQVAIRDEEVLGVCGLNIIWSDMAEIYALAVGPCARGQGLGRQLVQACIDEAESLGIRRQMALTYEQRFFEKLAFQIVDRESLPLKVWSQCVRCSKNQACDEIAMIHTHEHISEAHAPVDPPGGYEVPVVLNVTVASGTTRKKMDEAT